MKLTLIYSATTGESREETIELNDQHFTVGGLGSHNLSLPGGDGSLALNCEVSENIVRFKANTTVLIDKEPHLNGVWVAGQRMELGPHCLSLVSIDTDNIVIDVSLFAASSYLPSVNPFNKSKTAFIGRRSLSYILMLLVLGLGFAAPLAYHFFIKSGGEAQNWHGPTDAYWSSGPLVNAHQHRDIDGNCQACHSDLWIQAQDNNCLQCHETINAHAQYNPHVNLGQKEPRCASCHKEHSREIDIINYDSAGCIDCHQEPHLWSKNDNQVRPVSNFDADGHAPFKLQMLVKNNHGWQNQSVEYSADALENSNLKFSHELHLNVDKVDDQGQGLQCVSCHTLGSDNEHFVAITMEAHCIDCHTLGIDVEDDERQLPHGKPSEVVKSLEEFLSYQYVNPEFRKTRQQVNVRTRTIPGKAAIRSSFEMDPCESLESVYECISDEVEELAQLQFERAGCITCHEVSQTANKSIYERWQVEPIRLQTDWYAGHKFDHKAHLSGDYQESGAACLSCHFASVSETATDVLIPGQDNCLACHVQGDKSTVEMNCLSCHEFHRPHQPQMSILGAKS